MPPVPLPVPAAHISPPEPRIHISDLTSCSSATAPGQPATWSPRRALKGPDPLLLAGASAVLDLVPPLTCSSPHIRMAPSATSLKPLSKCHFLSEAFPSHPDISHPFPRTLPPPPPGVIFLNKNPQHTGYTHPRTSTYNAHNSLFIFFMRRG